MIKIGQLYLNMSKKQIIIPIATFLLGALIVHLSFFTVSDIRGYAPSYTDPLTEEEFVEAQQKGEAIFNGSPAPEENTAYNIEYLIECHRNTSVCDVASARVIEYTSGPSLETDLYQYNITQWSDDGLIKANLESDVKGCGIYSLEANVKTREVIVSYKSQGETNVTVCGESPIEGQTKLDFGQRRGFFGKIRSDLHYSLGELWY